MKKHIHILRFLISFTLVTLFSTFSFASPPTNSLQQNKLTDELQTSKKQNRGQGFAAKFFRTYNEDLNFIKSQKRKISCSIAFGIVSPLLLGLALYLGIASGGALTISFILVFTCCAMSVVGFFLGRHANRLAKEKYQSKYGDPDARFAMGLNLLMCALYFAYAILLVGSFFT